MEHIKDVRAIRDRIIESEVETRKAKSEQERILSQIERQE